MKWVVVLAALLVLTACTEEESLGTSYYAPSSVPDRVVRPVIEKVPPLTGEEGLEEGGVKGVAGLEPPRRLRVPDRREVFLLHYNESVQRATPLFSKYDFPKLLRSSSVQGLFKRGWYEQFLRLRGGRLLFKASGEGVGYFLAWEEGEPVFELELRLRGGSFIDFVGGYLWLLGESYRVEDSTLKDLVLVSEGGDVLVLGKGRALLNSKPLLGVRAWLEPGSLRVEVGAEPLKGEAVLGEGEDLASVLRNPYFLKHLRISFNAFPTRGEGLRFRTGNSLYLGLDGYEVPLVSYSDGFVKGGVGERLVLGSGLAEPGDLLAVTPPRGDTAFFQFKGLRGGFAEFKDLRAGSFKVELLNASGVLKGFLAVGGFKEWFTVQGGGLRLEGQPELIRVSNSSLRLRVSRGEASLELASGGSREVLGVGLVDGELWLKPPQRLERVGGVYAGGSGRVFYLARDSAEGYYSDLEVFVVRGGFGELLVAEEFPSR